MAEKQKSPAQIKAAEWFDTLIRVEIGTAVKMLAMDDPLPTLIGGIGGLTRRSRALLLINQGVRLSFPSQDSLHRHYRLVVLNKDGFPIHLKIKEV